VPNDCKVDTRESEGTFCWQVGGCEGLREKKRERERKVREERVRERKRERERCSLV
jgi:hypothetical protein